MHKRNVEEQLRNTFALVSQSAKTSKLTVVRYESVTPSASGVLPKSVTP